MSLLPEINVTHSAANSALREGPLSLAVSGGAHLAVAVMALVFSSPLLVGVNPPHGANVLSLSAAWLSTGEAEADSTPAEVTFAAAPAEITRGMVVTDAADVPLELIDATGDVVVAGIPTAPEVTPANATESQPAEPAADSPRLPKQPTAPLAVAAAATGLQIDVQPGKTFAPSPVYPPEALAAKLSGVVKLRVKIAADGTVKEARIDQTSGHEILDSAALKAIREWRFTPAKVQGVAVATEVRVPIRFQLQN